MKYFSTLLLFLFSTQASADSWLQKANFGGTSRHAACSFYVSGKGYIGTGGTFTTQKKDFWSWNPATNVWTQVADFGGTARSAAVAFAIGSLGYVATGFDNSLKKDVWAYDPSLNSWAQKADFGGSARHFATGFELNGYGYIGTGTGAGNFKDLWQYNPVTDTWTQKANFGGVARSSAASFAVDGKGYLGIGFGTSSALSDFWEYDPATDTWTQKANFGGGTRSDAVAFSICDKGYIATGVSGSDKKDIWEYDPAANTWTQKTSLTTSGREEGVGFSDGTYGYLGTGTNIASEFGDFWQYTPDQNDCTILPIGLTSFTATQSDRKVELRWTTESELNNDYFTVEKSLDGAHFETLIIVKGIGNSTSALSYVAEDLNPFTGLNYYRLKQTDFDGTSTYSNVISCTVYGIGMMKVLSVTPNPFQTTIDIITDISDDEDLQIQLFNTSGKLIFDKSYAVKKDVQHLSIDLSSLLHGIYFLRVACEYGSSSQKLVKIY